MALLACSLSAKAYVEPTKTIPELAHANSQSFYSIEVKSGENTLFTYTDAENLKPYNWLQETEKFNVRPGEELTMFIRSGIWSWDIQIGFDWDGDGHFEGIQRAFSQPGVQITESTSSWGVEPFKDKDWRLNQQTLLGHRGVIYHTFTVKVPDDAAIGTTRMRVLCDGDGYNNGSAPALNMEAPVGYAGSMHDFGIIVANQETVALPSQNVKSGTYNSDQTITLTCPTEGASIYYTLDGTEPSATNGTLYTEPIVLSCPEGENKTYTLKFIAVKDGMLASNVVVATYTIQKSWSQPGCTYHATEERYITSATTTGADINLDYSQNSKPQAVYINTNAEMTVKQGSKFTLQVKSTEDMKWCHAIVFVDWNENYSFDDTGEQLFKIGFEKMGFANVCDFSKEITVPTDAVIGKTRMRIQFTDAWHKKDEPGHTHSGDDAIDKGGVYDFVVNILDINTGISNLNAEQAKSNADVYNVMGVKVGNSLENLPTGLYIQNGKKVVVR